MEKNEPRKFVASVEQDGARLDAALAVIYPELGLRARRRLWSWCRVKLDGKPAGPGEYLRSGQLVEVEPLSNDENSVPVLPDSMRIIALQNGFCAIYKPAGLPSANIAGSKLDSAEKLVQANWEPLLERWSMEQKNVRPEQASLDSLLENVTAHSEPPLLCNRLDTETSGLLLWTFSQNSLKSFRELEAEGRVDKRYYALVEGEAPEQLYMDSALNMYKRDKTLALEEADPDPARHTSARCIALKQGRNGEILSLMDLSIRRGARHQIRAHLAAAGYPICGDTLYGTKKSDAGIMYLHHYSIDFEGFSAEALPLWLEEFPPVS